METFVFAKGLMLLAEMASYQSSGYHISNKELSQHAINTSFYVDSSPITTCSSQIVGRRQNIYLEIFTFQLSIGSLLIFFEDHLTDNEKNNLLHYIHLRTSTAQLTSS